MGIEEAKQLITPEIEAAITVAKKGAFAKTILGGIISGAISFGIFAFGLGEWKADLKNDMQQNKANIDRLETRVENDYRSEVQKDFDGRIFFLEDHTGFHKYSLSR